MSGALPKQADYALDYVTAKKYPFFVYARHDSTSSTAPRQGLLDYCSVPGMGVRLGVSHIDRQRLDDLNFSGPVKYQSYTTRGSISEAHLDTVI